MCITSTLSDRSASGIFYFTVISKGIEMALKEAILKQYEDKGDWKIFIKTLLMEEVIIRFRQMKILNI